MKNLRSRTSLVLVAAIGTAVFSLVVATGLILPPPSGQAIAQESNATTTQSIMPASTNKTFHIFSQEVEGVNATEAGIAGDIYSLPVIVVNKGDSVTVHHYNTETEEERHSFTIDAQPYSVNIDVAASESGNATFTADQEGIFPYYCKYHLPSMTGQLVVLPLEPPAM